jgi:hypothetical protein
VFFGMMDDCGLLVPADNTRWFDIWYILVLGVSTLISVSKHKHTLLALNKICILLMFNYLPNNLVSYLTWVLFVA